MFSRKQRRLKRLQRFNLQLSTNLWTHLPDKRTSCVIFHYIVFSLHGYEERERGKKDPFYVGHESKWFMEAPTVRPIRVMVELFFLFFPTILWFALFILNKTDQRLNSNPATSLLTVCFDFFFFSFLIFFCLSFLCGKFKFLNLKTPRWIFR